MLKLSLLVPLLVMGMVLFFHSVTCLDGEKQEIPVGRIGEILADLAKKVAKIKEFGKYTFKQLDQFTATEDNCRPATREQRDCFLFNHVLTVEVDTNLEARLDTNVSVNFIIAHGMITQIVVKRVNIQRSYLQSSADEETILQNQGRLEAIAKYLTKALLTMKINAQTIRFDNDGTSEDKIFVTINNWATKATGCICTFIAALLTVILAFQ